ncbi:MAG: hypothetical protein D6808_08250 [Candidatus Dadabacteria bacterium]|nr:MAG: hypothetical protein D6808_08250 [Candidatus Dadabacteria bacterium]
MLDLITSTEEALFLVYDDNAVVYGLWGGIDGVKREGQIKELGDLFTAESVREVLLSENLTLSHIAFRDCPDKRYSAVSVRLSSCESPFKWMLVVSKHVAGTPAILLHLKRLFHNIKSPLGIIQGIAELALDEAAADRAEIESIHLEQIRDACKKAAKLIDEFCAKHVVGEQSSL